MGFSQTGRALFNRHLPFAEHAKRVAVDHALLVRHFEGFSDRLGDGQGFIKRNRSLSDPISPSWWCGQSITARGSPLPAPDAPVHKRVGGVQTGPVFTGTIASTRNGLPLPFTSFSGAAMTTAPVGGRT